MTARYICYSCLLIYTPNNLIAVYVSQRFKAYHEIVCLNFSPPNGLILTVHDTINSGFLTRTLKSNVGTCRHRTISGECCVPFIYRRRRYNGCARHRSGRKWCYVTPDYRRNRLWGWCRGGTRCKAFLSSILFLFLVFIFCFLKVLL